MTDEELKDRFAALVAHNEKVDRQLEELGRKVERLEGRTTLENERKVETPERQMTLEEEWRQKNIDRWLDELCYEEEYYSPTQFFRDAFGKAIELGGVEYGKIKYKDMFSFDSRTNRSGEKFEIGLVLDSEDTVVLVETEEKIAPDFVAKFAEECAGKFRSFFRVYSVCKAYLGIAAYSFDDDVLAEAKKHGIGIIRKVGEGIEIEAENLKVY